MPYHKYLAELDEMTSVLSNKPQTVGFVHKFIVPGWIGIIQEFIIEHRMSKVAMQPLYNGLNYYKCGNRIADLVDDACVARIRSATDFVKSNDDPDNLRIMSSALRAVETWAGLYPEIAYRMNQKISNEYVTNYLSIIQSKVNDAITSIMNIDRDTSSEDKPRSFVCNAKDELMNMGWHLAAWVCNATLLIAIWSVLIVIFG